MPGGDSAWREFLPAVWNATDGECSSGGLIMKEMYIALCVLGWIWLAIILPVTIVGLVAQSKRRRPVEMHHGFEVVVSNEEHPDPAIHQQLERTMMEHVERLLADERLRVDTTRRAPACDDDVSFGGDGDRRGGTERVMSEMGEAGSGIAGKMPLGAFMEVTLSQKKWFFLKEQVGKLQVICVSPVRAAGGGKYACASEEF